MFKTKRSREREARRRRIGLSGKVKPESETSSSSDGSPKEKGSFNLQTSSLSQLKLICKNPSGFLNLWDYSNLKINTEIRVKTTARVNINIIPSKTLHKASPKKTKHDSSKTMNLESSRIPNVICDCILAVDKAFSASMATVCSKSCALRILCEVTEILGNGFVWLAIAIYHLTYPRNGLYEQSLNFLFGLILDIVACATTKQVVKRKRPKFQVGESLMIGPDQFSFPSGHASRWY